MYGDIFIIGNGNVVMDVVCIFFKFLEEFVKIDIVVYVFDVFFKSKIYNICIIGWCGFI